MAKKYTCPPQTATGAGTFSDDLVGFQLVQGGGLTQGNFEFTVSVTEKSNRSFEIGTFSEPITLETLKIDSLLESRALIAKNYQVYPNFDLSDVTRFTLYGSLSKRLSESIEDIVNKFPAGFECNKFSQSFISGRTAYNIVYDSVDDETSFDIDVNKIKNPFDIDYTTNAALNLSVREIPVSELRNFTDQYQKYILYTNGSGYTVTFMTPMLSANTGVMSLTVKGNPFSGVATSYDDLLFRPNDYYVELTFVDKFDEVQKFLLNRLVSPIYTSTFAVPQETDSGQYFIQEKLVTWPLDGIWNLDIRTTSFNSYLETLSEIGEIFDTEKTNLISRFLTTGSLKDFDTMDQKTEKMLQIYGRSFDETKKFIDALAFMNSVNYVVNDDIPSQLLKNLSETLGWQTNISPITNESFLDAVFGNTSVTEFPGYSRPLTPNELNYQFYRNLILNSAFLFKSKGTRKSIECLMRLIGAPEALIEFNENIYLADQRINMTDFDIFFANISGGTYVRQTPTLDSTIVFSVLGRSFTGFTSTYSFENVNLLLDDYPVDDYGFPSAPEDTEDFFFQKGAGWYQSTPQHRSPEKIDITSSVFTGSNPNVQTNLEPFTYGQKYLDRFRDFPFIEEGFKLIRTVDNRKSWTLNDNGLRRYSDGGFNSYYYNYDDRLVLNVKNVDLFLNPSFGLAYDVWVMCNTYDYPIPQSGMSAPYPSPPGIDWTEINPQPKKLTFFEFAQTFWRNLINVRDRQFNHDGKTSGYPTLQSIWWAYLNSGVAINVPNDQFTYQNMIDYVVGIGDYWIRLVEQMIPATTIWNGGLRYENSLFHRQKFVWRRQAGCQLIPIPCTPCQFEGNLFPNNCPIQITNCNIYPWQTNLLINDFNGLLSLLTNRFLTSNGLTINDCITSTLTSRWYIELYHNTTLLVNYEFFQGYSMGAGSSVPTIAQYLTSIDNAFQNLYTTGFYYYVSPATNPTSINFMTVDCNLIPVSDTIDFKVRIDINILCN